MEPGTTVLDEDTEAHCVRRQVWPASNRAAYEDRDSVTERPAENLTGPR